MASIVATNNGATITISTTDFVETGMVSTTGGELTWNTLISNTENAESQENIQNTEGNTTGEEIQTTILTQNNLNKMIGKEVIYEGYTSVAPTGWRLFYADENNVYIITTTPLIHDILSTSESTVENAMSEGSYGAQWNSLWLGKEDKITNEENHLAAAYLCDKNNWRDFVAHGAPEGTYAVGGPTLELFIASWNKREQGVSEVSIGEDYVVSGGYTNIGNVISSGIMPQLLPTAEGRLDGLYLSYGVPYFLASPYSSKYSKKYLCLPFLSGSVGSLSGENYDSARVHVRPIVVIPISGITEGKGINTGKLEVIINK